MNIVEYSCNNPILLHDDFKCKMYIIVFVCIVSDDMPLMLILFD
jgi:hypothetical protein